ncbi:Uncharacterized protein Fot_42262 [Forsythia ovata]|uniref:Uncharacterized protein n=1 Tax=Forsythia ovata TaxID=205694 RepID=A0ABD1RKN6_9LAMI
MATNEEKNKVYALGLFHKKQAVNECGASFSRLAPDVDTDDDNILVNDSTPDIPRKRLRKVAAMFRSPYTSNFRSSKKSEAIVREIRTGTYALSDELNVVANNDVVDFEEWYIALYMLLILTCTKKLWNIHTTHLIRAPPPPQSCSNPLPLSTTIITSTTNVIATGVKSCAHAND